MALAVFGAIIGLRCVGFVPAGSEPMTSQEFYEWKKTQPQEYANWTETRPFDPSRRIRSDEYSDAFHTGPQVKHGWYFQFFPASVSDFGTPLFILAVFYVGLFFLLGEQKARR